MRLDLEEYKRRAIPRLAQIDRLDERCEWEKFDCQCSLEVQALRERRKRLMDEQGADEVAAGL
jgi:hypothetical protein